MPKVGDVECTWDGEAGCWRDATGAELDMRAHWAAADRAWHQATAASDHARRQAAAASIDYEVVCRLRRPESVSQPGRQDCHESKVYLD